MKLSTKIFACALGAMIFGTVLAPQTAQAHHGGTWVWQTPQKRIVIRDRTFRNNAFRNHTRFRGNQWRRSYMRQARCVRAQARRSARRAKRRSLRRAERRRQLRW